MCNIRRLYGLRDLCEADFYKPGIDGSGRVRANAWDVFRRALYRYGRGCRAAVDIGVFLVGRMFYGFFFRNFFSLNAHGLLQA